MSLVSLSGPFVYPNSIGAVNGGPSAGTLVTMTSAGHYGAYVFQARENMTITHVGFRAGTVAGSPTAEVRIETVDATGFPSGTLWATNTNGTTGTITSSSNPLQVLTASASITKGQFFCVKIAYASGTSIIIQNLNIGQPFSNTIPYQVVNTGTPTKNICAGALIALGSSSTTFYQLPSINPCVGTTNSATYNNTNSAKRGLKFSLPFNCRIAGVRFYQSTQIGDYNAGIYDATGTGVGSTVTAFDGDYAGGGGNGMSMCFFSTPLSYTANTTYYAAIEPTTTTNVNMALITLPSNDYFTAMPGGANCLYSVFATSAWTDTTTGQLPFLDLIIDQIDDGAGGGGGGVIGVIGS